MSANPTSQTDRCPPRGNPDWLSVGTTGAGGAPCAPKGGHTMGKPIRRTVVIPALATLTGLCVVVATASASATVRTGPVPTGAAARPAATQLTTAQALARARSTGTAVPVDGSTTATDTVVANPTGTLTLTRSALPVRKRVGGSWVALDPGLRRTADGTVTPTVTTNDLTLSGGGAGPLAKMTVAGRSLALSLPMTLPAPTLSGPTATYAGVLPDVDLQVTADPYGGFSEVLVVHTRAAATDPALTTLRLTTATTGVTVTADAAGNLTARDRTGRAVFTAPQALAWDSAGGPTTATGTSPAGGVRVQANTGRPVASSSAGPGAGAHVARVATAAGPAGITLTPSRSLLTAADTVYPVYLDPSWSALGSQASGWASISEYFPSSNYFDRTPDPQGYQQVGNSGSMWSHTLVNFPIDVAKLRGATIQSAALSTTEVYSYSCSPSSVNVPARATTLTASNATWNAWSGVNLGGAVASATVAHGYNSSCPGAGVGFNVLSAVTADVAANKTTQTFVMTGVNESSDHNSWKEFLASGNGGPTLSITYNHPPDTPSGLTTSPATACTAAPPTTVGDAAVSLYAPVSDPDGGNLGVAYALWKTSSPGTILASSNPASLTYPAGTVATLVVPESTLKTAAAGTITEFSWHVQVTDTIATSAWSVTCNFNFDPTRTGQPTVTAPSGLTMRQTAVFTVAPPPSGVVPTSYLYQLDGAATHTMPATSGTAGIAVSPTRFTNVLSVTSLSAGGNVGDMATVTFNATPPATIQADQDFTGDGFADLLTVGARNGLAAGLWLASGQTNIAHTAGTGQVNTAVMDVGANRNNLVADNKPADFTGAQTLPGHFTGTRPQDVLPYHPARADARAGAGPNRN